MTTPDDELLSKAIEGDKAAMRTLLEANAPTVRSRLAPLIPDRWRSIFDLDDIMQQAYVDAFVGIARFKPQGEGSFAAWLTTLAKCTLIDAIRLLEADKRGGDRRQIRPANQSDSIVALYDLVGQTWGTPSRHAAKHEAGAAVKRAIEELPPAQRQVVEMFDLDGKSVEEVASAMGRSTGAVYLLRVRAHRRLAELLGSSSRYLSAQ